MKYGLRSWEYLVLDHGKAKAASRSFQVQRGSFRALEGATMPWTPSAVPGVRDLASIHTGAEIMVTTCLSHRLYIVGYKTRGDGVCT